MTAPATLDRLDAARTTASGFAVLLVAILPFLQSFADRSGETR